MVETMKVKDLIQELIYFLPDNEVSFFGHIDGESYRFEIDEADGKNNPMITLTGEKL